MKAFVLVLVAGLSAALAPPLLAEEHAPAPVVLKMEVNAAPPAVWQALTTEDGVRSFFARAARIEPRVGGAYEIYFYPDNAPGLRGTEGVRILAMEEPTRLMVSWNAPPRFSRLRGQQSVVEIELAPVGQDRTLVTMTHSGWGRGPDWERLSRSFALAWPMVLGRLQYRFEHGPVDWSRPPDGAAYFRPAS